MTLTAKGAGFYKDFVIILLVKLFKVKIIYHFHNKGVALNSKNGITQCCINMRLKILRVFY